MAKKQKTNISPSYASKKGTHDTFGRIYESMATSTQYQNLSLGARQMYTLCLVQSNSSKGKRTLYNHGKEIGREYSDSHFVFPAMHQKEYGIKDRSNATKYLNELEKAGFIRKTEKNSHCQKVNVYQFIDKWKTDE